MLICTFPTPERAAGTVRYTLPRQPVADFCNWMVPDCCIDPSHLNSSMVSMTKRTPTTAASRNSSIFEVTLPYIRTDVQPKPSKK